MDEFRSIQVGGRSYPETLLDLVLGIPRYFWLLWFAALLRFANLGQEQLWYDESTTVWIVKLPLDRMITALRGDVHPPLWFFIERLNIALWGDSAYAVRLPAAILGVAIVWLVWRLALALNFDRTTAYLAGFLAAIMPGALYYSQDARMYPLLTAAVLVAALAAANRSWPVFTVAAIVGIYAHNLAFFYMGLIGLIFFWRTLQPIMNEPGRAGLWVDGLRGPVYSVVVIALFYLPWLPALIHQTQNVSEGYWIQPLSWERALFPYLTLTMGWRASDVFQLHIYTVSLVASLLGLIVLRDRLFRSYQGAILLAVIGAPVAIALVSVLWRSVYIDRALLPAATGLMIVWASLLVNLKRSGRRAMLAVLCPALAIGVIAHYWPVQPRQDESQFVSAIKDGLQSGDIVYFLQIGAAGSMTYYLPGVPYATLPEQTNLSQSFSMETRSAMGFNDVPFANLESEGYRRAWLICSINPVISADELRACDDFRAMYPNRLVTADTAESNNESFLYLVQLKGALQ